ncbi:MAG: ABC transporter substrate-binding protein [Rickettsiales bacterium]
MLRVLRYSLVLLLAVTCQLAGNNVSYAAEVENSELREERVAFANSFANIVLAVISDQKKTEEQRKDNLAQAFSKSVDIEWIAKFVIGRNWNNATEEQRVKYTELYREFLTKTYVENFAENPERRISAIKIVDVSDSNSSDFNVATQIHLSNQDRLNVNYLVREKEKRYKVLDIAIENVSLINTHRAEFAALAASRGVEGVIEKLAKLVSGNPTIAMVAQ